MHRSNFRLDCLLQHTVLLIDLRLNLYYLLIQILFKLAHFSLQLATLAGVAFFKLIKDSFQLLAVLSATLSPFRLIELFINVVQLPLNLPDLAFVCGGLSGELCLNVVALGNHLLQFAKVAVDTLILLLIQVNRIKEIQVALTKLLAFFYTWEKSEVSKSDRSLHQVVALSVLHHVVVGLVDDCNQNVQQGNHKEEGRDNVHSPDESSNVVVSAKCNT